MKKFTHLFCTLFCFVLLLASSDLIHGQFARIGNDIDGEAAGDLSGRSVSLSSDGSRIAIGAQNNDGTGIRSDHVRVYEQISGVWTQLGNDIDGEAANDFSGFSVSLSSDGKRVAMGAIGNDANGNFSGHVRVYEWSSGIWTKLGDDIDGEATNDLSGYSVSLSSDGKRVAIGAYANSDAGYRAGHVRVYEWVGGIWSQLGNDIVGEAAEDNSGISTALSAGGNRVVIGAWGNDGNGSNSGHVRVHEFSGGVWTQIGNDIDGESAGDGMGWRVAINSVGNRIITSAFNNDDNGTNAGQVRVYELKSGDWAQLGQDIDGEAAGDLLAQSVDISANGNRIAIGAERNDGNGDRSGHVRVYDLIRGSWVQLCEDIDGEAEGDASGWSVSLTPDGSIVAIGAPYNGGNGVRAGHVRVFELDSDNDNICFENDNCPYDYNPDQQDSDCDQVGDVCDVCDGGNDAVDNNKDGFPDCANPPSFNMLHDAWKCGQKLDKVLMCHNINNNPHTICVSQNAMEAHLAQGDFLGPCTSCTSSSELNNNIDINTTQLNVAASIRIYPNPFADQLTLGFHSDNTGSSQISLYSISGKQLIPTQIMKLTQKGHNEFKLGGMNLAEGLYIIRLILPDGVVISRRVVRSSK